VMLLTHFIWQTDLKPLSGTNAKNGAITPSLTPTMHRIHVINTLTVTVTNDFGTDRCKREFPQYQTWVELSWPRRAAGRRAGKVRWAKYKVGARGGGRLGYECAVLGSGLHCFPSRSSPTKTQRMALLRCLRGSSAAGLRPVCLE